MRSPIFATTLSTGAAFVVWPMTDLKIIPQHDGILRVYHNVMHVLLGGETES